MPPVPNPSLINLDLKAPAFVPYISPQSATSTGAIGVLSAQPTFIPGQAAFVGSADSATSVKIFNVDAPVFKPKKAATSEASGPSGAIPPFQPTFLGGPVFAPFDGATTIPTGAPVVVGAPLNGYRNPFQAQQAKQQQ